MKNAIIITTLITLISSLNLKGQDYSLNLKNSTIEWTGYAELGGYSQSGTISPFSGRISIENEELQAAEVIIDMRSIQSNDEELASHLKNKDFFNSKKYPFAELNMISVTEGSLTIKEITKDIILVYEITTSENSVLISGKMMIDRTLFGMRYNSSSFFDNLGDYAIKNEFEIKFKLVFNQ